MNTQDNSRKILEDLNFKKQQLQKGLPIVKSRKINYHSRHFQNYKYNKYNKNNNRNNSQIQATPNPNPLLESQQINTAARATYQQAQSSSFGNFILTDSSFGNSLLPVIPRFD